MSLTVLEGILFCHLNLALSDYSPHYMQHIVVILHLSVIKPEVNVSGFPRRNKAVVIALCPWSWIEIVLCLVLKKKKH